MEESTDQVPIVFEKTISLVHDLRVTEVDSHWIEEAIAGNFCEIEGLPAVVSENAKDSNYFVSTLSELRDVSKSWLTIEDSNKFWILLPDQGIQNKAFLTVLASFLTLKGKTSPPSWQDVSSVIASSIYLSLVLIPGSGAHGILNQTLLAKSVENLARWPRSGFSQKRKRGQKNQKRGGKSKRSRTGVALDREQSNGIELNGEVNEDEGAEEIVDDGLGSITIDHAIRNAVLELIKDVTDFIQKVALKDYRQVLYSTVQVLCHLTRCECFHDNFRHPGKSLRELAFQAISSLCSETHGDLRKISRSVMNCCMPGILMLDDDKPVQTVTIPKNLQIIKSDAVDFVCKLASNGNPTIAESVRVLVQNMCVKVPDRAEYRNIVSSDICKIMFHLPEDVRNTLTDWLKKYSKNVKIGYRVFALDIMSNFLLLEEVPSNRDQQSQCIQSMLQSIFNRCSDRSPTVRAKALTCLTNIANSQSRRISATLKDMLSSSINPSSLFQTQNLSDDANSEFRGSERTTILDLIRRRIKDERVLVRKAAVQVFRSILVLSEDVLSNDDITLVFERCMDQALSVRKQAVQSLTQLLEYSPANKQLQMAWLNGVLPMVSDREMTAQEKCVALLEEIVLCRMVSYERSTDQSHNLAWSLLDKIAGVEGQELSQYFNVVCENWGKNGKFNADLVKKLQTHLNTGNSKAAWLFISAISASCDKFDPKIITEYWFKNIDDNSCSDAIMMSRILKTMMTIANKLPKELANRLLDDIQLRIFKLRCPPDLISLCVQCLSKLFMHLPDGEEKLKSWCKQMLSICDSYISESVLGTEHAIPIDKNEIIKRLVTLGDIAQLYPSNTNERMFLMVQSFLLPQQPEKGSSDESHDRLQNLNISSTIKAHAFGTLGKLCLQNEALAKKCVATLARELERSDDAAVKNNIIVILCDLCVSYTNLVDRYIPKIAGCLADREPIVRRQALTLLTHILQEDFVKWKGSLFFRFITALVDDIAEIRNFAEFCLIHMLLPRHPTMFSQHFMETIFCFNSYTKHRVYNQFHQTDAERKKFSLAGPQNRRKRMKIYTFLLQNMNDESRFKLTGKICNEIFGAIVDDVLPVDSHSKPVIEDAFAIMICQEIKIASAKSKHLVESEEGLDEEQQEMASNLRAKVISQIVKKNMIENIFPTIISLKKRFEQEKSPLLRELMHCLKELMIDYKTEIQDVLAGDRQLANEIEFDLRRYEEGRKQAAMEAMHPGTPNRNTPQHQVNLEMAKTPLGRAMSNHPLVSIRSNSAMAPRSGVAFTPPRLKTPSNRNVLHNFPQGPQTVPAHIFRGERQQTSAKQNNMAVTALITSAKKAMERMKRLSISEHTPIPMSNLEEWDDKENTPAPLANDFTPARATTPKQMSENAPIISNSNFKSPEIGTTSCQDELKDDMDHRAISTPQAQLSHISFLAPNEISVIPMMQSPSIPIKIARKSRRKGNQRKHESAYNDQIVCMPSLDKQPTKSPQWNLISPAGLKKL